VTQELVRIDGETICATPSVADQIGRGLSVQILYEPAPDGRVLRLSNGRTVLLRACRYRWPFARWWAAARGRSWRSPELKAARLLFHLERHGIPAPRLLAYGQIVPHMRPARSFLLSEPLAAVRPSSGDRAAVRELLDRLHAACAGLLDLGAGGEPFGLVNGRVVIVDPFRLRLFRRPSRRRDERDRALVDALFRGAR
jgi:hypothetical protein